MTRITYIDHSVEECDLSLNEVLRIRKYSKIEKQIKDLTLEEIYKICASRYGNDLYRIAICEDALVVNWYNNYGEITFNEYPFDQYIDITDLVKGE